MPSKKKKGVDAIKMKQPSQEYWSNRFTKLQDNLMGMGDDYIANSVESAFKVANTEIEKEISMWYQRFADNNGHISMADAKAMLNKGQLDELRWSVDDYIKNAEQNRIPKRMQKKLENASAKAHISRLESLQLQMQMQIEKLYGMQQDGLESHLQSVYSQGFYKTAFEVDKGVGVATDLSKVNLGNINGVISKPWTTDGLTFSDRLWRDKERLNKVLCEEIVRNSIRGGGVGEATKAVAKRMQVATSSAARLVATETAFFSTKAQNDCFEKLGVKKYEFVATLDGKTSDICQSLDGKVFEMKEFSPGTNAPPMHCWCRSCTVPYFDDLFGLEGTRAARDTVTNQTIQVPASVTYQEWKNKVNGKAKMFDGWQKDTVTPKNKSKIIDIEVEVAKASGHEIVHKDLPIYINAKSIEELNQGMTGLIAEPTAINGAVQFIFDEKMDLAVAKEISKHIIELKQQYITDPIYGVTSQYFSKFEENGVFSRLKNDLGGQLTVANRSKYKTAEEYSRLVQGSHMGRSGFDGTTLVDPQNANIATTYHEFAHSFGVSNQRKMAGTEPFWKEISAIKKEYEQVKYIGDNMISQYADTDVNEFLAEAFTQAKLYSKPSPYALKVLDVVDKYFALDKIQSDVIVGRDFEKIKRYKGKLDNKTVRMWYNDQNKKIINKIDKSASVEEQAKQACEFRIENRKNARELMADTETREWLDEKKASLTFDDLVKDKMVRKGLTEKEAFADIVKSATKTNKMVNDKLGVK